MRRDQDKFNRIINEYTNAEGNLYRKLKIYLWDYQWYGNDNVIYVLNKNYKSFIEELKTLTGEILLNNNGKIIHINRK